MYRGGAEVLDLATNCTAGVVWIWNTFGQCVETSIEYVAFILGFISFILWLLPCIPQIYQNYKRGHCDDALSIYFLFFWFFGDSLNLSGAILSKQLPIQIYIGVYFIFQDCIILTQYFYYKVRGGWRLRMLHDLGRPTLSCLMVVSVVGCYNNVNKVGAGPAGFILSNGTYYPNEVHKLYVKPFFDGGKDEIGYIFGSMSAFCYLAGRLPQLYKNLKRRSTEGVSLLMFLIIIAGNLTYGTSVLFSGDTVAYVLHHLPWLVGSFACCLLDTIVLYQYVAYGRLRRRQAAAAASAFDVTSPTVVAETVENPASNDVAHVVLERNDSKTPFMSRDDADD